MRNSHFTLPALGLLGALFLNGTATAQCPAADAFEPNDDCTTAATLVAGTVSATAAGPTNPAPEDDYYEIVVPSSTQLDVDAIFSHATGDIDIYLYSDAGTCATQVDSSLSVSDNEDVTWQNNTAGPITVSLKTRYWDSPAGWQCNDYDLVVTLTPIAPSPCLSQPDDAFTPNQDCLSAAAVTNGLYVDLWAFKGVAEDYYKVDVPDGGTITVDALFLQANGDIDMELYTSEADCIADLNVDGSFSTTDDEQVTDTNLSGGTLTYYVHVYVWNSSGNQDCNTYDLNIDVNSPVLGTAFCFGDGTAGACPCLNESAVGAGEGCNHSGGNGAILTAGGTASFAAADLEMYVTQAIPNQTSMLVQGSSLIQSPFKDGILCMGNPTERVVVIFLDANGDGDTIGDDLMTLGNIPGPGVTRYFQAWYRNTGGISPCGTGSNFTQGLELVITP